MRLLKYCIHECKIRKDVYLNIQLSQIYRYCAIRPIVLPQLHKPIKKSETNYTYITHQTSGLEIY